MAGIYNNFDKSTSYISAVDVLVIEGTLKQALLDGSYTKEVYSSLLHYMYMSIWNSLSFILKHFCPAINDYIMCNLLVDSLIRRK